MTRMPITVVKRTMMISIMVTNTNDKVGQIALTTKDLMAFVDIQDLITTNAQTITTISIGLITILTHILLYSIPRLIVLTTTPMVIMVPMDQISMDPIMEIVRITTTV